MSAGKDEVAQEVVIVRRKVGDEDDHHHGGVWKIAYADFMTAMMAFFLVMWLINASNTETKSRIASYFNPIKLTDSRSLRKGLQDPDAKPEADPVGEARGKGGEGAGKAGKDGGARPEKGAQAGAVPPSSTVEANPEPHSGGGMGEASASGNRQSGMAFRDPFNPLSGARFLAEGEAGTRRRPETPPVPPPADEERPGAGAGEALAKILADAASDLQQQAESLARQASLTGKPAIDVKVEGDQIVLSLTDTGTFGMFGIGSARPADELVKLLGVIAPVIAGNADRVIVRGHTDARSWVSPAGNNNNWKLSMARAQTAYELLRAAGIEEARFERIEAYAERRPKVSGDPDAAANRRIEILLRKEHRP